jgi:creatinine amidohydrolase
LIAIESMISKGGGNIVKILYDEMSWPEVKEAVKDKRVPLIPVGSTEQHGPHLPTKTDAFLAYEVCRAVAARVPEVTFVMPPVNYGYNEHHLDFPATIHIAYETLIKFVLDIGKSLAHHGFERMIIVNGHGSNTAPMEITSRRITLETAAICASLTYLTLNPEVFTLLEGESGHAGELETSLMLYLEPRLVDKGKARKDWRFPRSRFIKLGIEKGEEDFAVSGGRAQFMDWWSRLSSTGVLGDPTKASQEKGERAFKLFVEALTEFVQEFRSREIPRRKDYH